MSEQDPRVRELTYRLMAMAPDAPKFPEEATMSVPDSRRRPPVLIWVGAAVAVVLLIGVPLVFLRGGGGGTDRAATTVPPTTSPATPTSVANEPGEESTTAAPTGVQTVTFSVYLLSDTLRTATGDPALVPVQRTVSVESADSLDKSEMMSLAITELIASDSVPGYSSSVPADTELLGVTGPRIGVYRIDLSAAYASGGGSLAMFTRLAQVVYTATQFGTEGAVEFSLDGETVTVFSSEGIILDGPQNRADYTDMLPHVFLDAPAVGAAVESPAGLRGTAVTSDGMVGYEIVGDGEMLANGSTSTGCYPHLRCGFSVHVDFSVPEEMEGEVIVFEVSSQDGSRINELRYPVTLLPGGSPGVTTTEAPTTTTLPGEAFDIGPAAGQVVAVVGVAHDDVLNLRAGPGVDFNVLVGLDPLSDDLVATGRHRLLPGSIWDEVTVGGVTGWVNSSYVAYLGGVDDLTNTVVSRIAGQAEAETMLQMGQLVGAALASFDETGGRVVVTVPPVVGDLGEITMDVIGLADDAQVGWRLHIFGTPSESGEGFVLRSVEATSLCGRGVTADGFCI